MTERPAIPRILAEELARAYARLERLSADVLATRQAQRRIEIFLDRLARDPERCIRAFADLPKGLGEGPWEEGALRARLQAIEADARRLDERLDEVEMEVDWVERRAREAAEGLRAGQGQPWPERPRPLRKALTAALSGLENDLSRRWLRSAGISNAPNPHLVRRQEALELARGRGRQKPARTAGETDV